MKFFSRYKPQLLGLFCVLYTMNFFSQDKQGLDSSYFNFLKLTNADQMLDGAPALISALTNNMEDTKAAQIIEIIEQLPMTGAKKDYQKGIVLLSKALLYRKQDKADKSSALARQALPLLENNKMLWAEGQSLIVMNYNLQGQFDSCIQAGLKCLPEVKKSKNVSSQLEVLTSIARSYDFIGDRKKAIELSLQAIELAKQHKKNNKLSELYISLGSIYKEEDSQLAKKYALMALKALDKDKNANTTVNACYLILGNVYYDLKFQDSSYYYYQLCKELSKKTNDQRMYLAAVGNLGNIAMDKKEYGKALEYNQLALTEYKKMGIPTEIAVSYGSLADLHKEMQLYDKAIRYYDSALVITKQIQSADDYIYNYKGLSETYEMMGNAKEAFKYYKLYTFWNDSVNNNQNSKKINELELEYKYKAQQHEKDLEQSHKDQITQEKIKQQKYIIWVAVLGGLSLVIFLGFTIKTNIERKKTNAQLQSFNDEIIHQKNIIEEKNHEITDSITYASRIQQGVIPDEGELKDLLPNHFVFFKPRDIVSGDFYWASKVKSKLNPNSKRSVVAVVDCTGHGVPGAFMSLVGNTLLNQTIGRSAIATPGQALDYINAQLPKTIKSKSSTGTIKDGMEIAMCDFNFDAQTMTFAGANSNIYLVRDGAIHIYKGDKQPIGESFSGTVANYKDNVINLQKNDCIYLISDGYADQFGGEKGKKFKYKQLENLFVSIATKTVDEQRAVLEKSFNDWMASYEQVDDVLVMGIKI